MAAKKSSGRRKYGKAAQKSVKRAMHKRKTGTLKSGKGRHPKVKSREQAIAIGLSEARAKGAKVPRKKSSKKSTRKSTRKSSAKRSSSRRKSASKRSR
ncbi:MAG: DUF6496 domain-containing protein [Gemmatimonadota bacterium]|nr:DUF6496 domain-containing protein [Gemmatimonadota bacterium]